MQHLPRYLFVYGTLMRGEVFHDQLQGAELFGAAVSQPCFELVDMGSHPIMVRGGCVAVHGELYRVNAEIIARLDEFEDHPRGFTRETIWIDELGEVECYLGSRDHAGNQPRIRGGDWRQRRRRKPAEGGEER